ncbi:MAG: Rpn family recombination-promoting nuclease/putative transposase [Bernardetiaceae bacterium]|nr:Rpn family recombination-promoting nuclease/putative transposase [Bernardetiaceae bacterium]
MTITLSKDALWKGIITSLFEPFMHYFYEDFAADIDFSRKPEFLDKELDEIYPQSDSKKRRSDKLIKFFLQNGDARWVLVHVEVQGYRDEDFPERMFTMYYRIRDRFSKPNLTSFVIYTDSSPNYAPDTYTYSYQDIQLRYTYGTFKVLDYTEKELDKPNNPFSIVMLTTLKSLQKEGESNYAWRIELVRRLKEANYDSSVIRNLLSFIRFYVKFSEPSDEQEFENETSTILNLRKDMTLDRYIAEAFKDDFIAEGIEQGIEIGRAEEKLQIEKEKIQKLRTTIRNILEVSSFSNEMIAGILEVEVEFVQQVRKEWEEEQRNNDDNKEL